MSSQHGRLHDLRFGADDLADIRRSIQVENPTAAVRLIGKFFRLFELLAANPELGMERPEFPGKLRIHFAGNYAIVYQFVGASVEFARILHGARDFDAILG